MDYTALNPVGARSQIGEVRGILHYNRVSNDDDYDIYINPSDSSKTSCSTYSLWNAPGDGRKTGDPDADVGTRTNFGQFPDFYGAIVRSSYYVTSGTGQSANPEILDLKLSSPVKMAKITDGSSKTAVLTEKYIPADQLAGDSTGDDAGWSDGWDFDTIRSSGCQPTPDSGSTQPGSETKNVAVGSSHASVFLSAFADGSVHTLSYDIDLETFNRLAHRSDGEVIDSEY